MSALSDEEKKNRHKEYMRQYRRKNAEKLKEQRRANYQTRREELSAAALERYHANKVEINQKRKEKYYEDPDAVNKKRREWGALNKDKQRITDEKYRAENKKEISEYGKRYRSENKELISAHMRNRRALVRGAKGSHTAEQVFDLLLSQKGLCASCSTKLKHEGREKYHVDHVMPLSLGGTNSIDNLQVLCPHCNLSKHNKHPDEWDRIRKETGA